MKRYTVIFLFAFCTTLFPQEIKEFPTGFSTIFKNFNEVNSYYFGNNPAVLDFETGDELLSIKSQNDLTDGDFKKFIEPKSLRNYYLGASGKKEIDANQRFKGSFGFQRNERRDWTWIFTREYQTGNPFLLGDSTTGNTRINGILINAEYSINLSNDISAGILLNYSVDEAMKQVSPRPTAIHRDIHTSIGINYKLSSNFQMGLVANVYDNNERIAYREDEGALTQETIIIKFKGYDYPNVFRKKTETRYSYINGYSGGLTFTLNPSSSSVVTGFFYTGFTKTNLKDDAISPKSEGFWSNDIIHGGLQYLHNISEGWQTGLIYKFKSEDGWAKYSPYNVLYYDRKISNHSVEAGLKAPLVKNVSVGIETGLEFKKNEEVDHYSAINSNYNSTNVFIRGGASSKITDYLQTIISYSYLIKTVSNNQITNSGSSPYYDLFRKYDLLYDQSEYSGHIITATAALNINQSDLIYLHLNYLLLKPDVNSSFSGSSNSKLSAFIEYRIKVY
ncbi:MAG: hypothetical protein Q8N03_10155 [Ignavibacteria bacterium]|nr:hypothetical protein [Ignavibacteria bacterium]